LRFFPSLLLPLSFFPLKNQTSIALLPPPPFSASRRRYAGRNVTARGDEYYKRARFRKKAHFFLLRLSLFFIFILLLKKANENHKIEISASSFYPSSGRRRARLLTLAPVRRNVRKREGKMGERESRE
jgi:hypothetical protein